MPAVRIETIICAPIELCFDLARDVEAHVRTSSFSQERVVPPGRTEGLLDLGDTVTFEGRHFGIRQRLTATIVELERPHRFVDEMRQGAFRSLRHVHQFHRVEGGTNMVDLIAWESPFGLIGRVADLLFLRRHMRSFIIRKQQELKRMAEQIARGTP